MSRTEAPPIDRVLGDLVTDLRSAWERSDALFALLDPQAWLARPIPLRHPFAFYAGHLPAFAWNQIGRGVLGRSPLDARLDVLYARGIDPMEEAAAPAGTSAWPTERETAAYRDRARDALLDVVADLADVADGDPLAERGRVVRLVLEHEWMHHETLLYMLQELPHALKRRPPILGTRGPRTDRGVARDAARDAARVRRHLVSIPAGRVRLGADFDAVPFGWDNEFPAHDVEVDAFSIDATPVANAEFAAFVEAGGYRREELFELDDWAWIGRHAMEHPHAWRREAASFVVRGLFADAPLDEVADLPVQVSYCEALAYARWRGATLPTEAQFHRAAYGTREGATRAQPWGDAPPDADRANLGFVRWGPDAVGSHPLGASAFGVHELVGNGWEWTRSPFAPFDGFTAWARTYPGYSKDFFDGQHRVLLGGSWATDARLVRRSFRNWFQPRYPYVFSKFRCVVEG